MPYKDGKSGNPAGRPKGTPNKTSKELKEMIADFLARNFDKIQKDFEKLEPKERLKVYCELLQYAVPKLKSIEDHGPFEHMTDQQLDHIIDELKKAP